MNRTFLDACAGKDAEHTPVWFMRQAGRYLPSYVRLKGTKSVLDITKNPEWSSQAVVDAVEALGVDAAIIFADIMLPLEGMGIDFTIVENVGPVVKTPIRTMDAVNSLEEFDPSTDVSYVLDGIDATIRKLDGSVPLLGFSGAPFTLAGYVIEGQPSRDLLVTKRFMHSQPEAWHALMEKITKMAVSYLGAQVRQGVDAVQLFDSWVGCLSKEDYDRYVARYTKEVFASVRGVPTIHFCADSYHLIESFRRTGPDVISVDWRVPIEQVWERTGRSVSVQGNLDPVVASTGGREMDRQVASILRRSEEHRDRHIFSLGHGVLRETDPENLKRVVRMVHRATRRRG